jgi:methionyl-tRNA formyltransferase
MQKNNPTFAFFGTPEFAVIILDELKRAGILPALVVAAPDKPKGRHLVLTSPPVKVWALTNAIPVVQPEKLNEDFLAALSKQSWDLFIVAAYGKILKKTILDIPVNGTLNVHPSLLPLFRGSSPIESAILEGVPETGVSIMLLDELMDHGPILAQKKVPLNEDTGAAVLERELALLGGAMLAEVIPAWIKGEITAIPQDDSIATVTKKIKKEDGLIDLSDDQIANYRKILAYEGWPRTYFMHEGKRIIITNAEFKDGELKIKKVLPEGKKEMNYEDFMRG